MIGLRERTARCTVSRRVVSHVLDRVIDGRAVRVENVVDLAPPGQVWIINDRTQFLETRAAITWTGRRRYIFADGPKWVLRRWEQVGSPGHMRTLRSLVVTPGHPMHRGQPVNICRDNVARFTIGHTGDAVVPETIAGFQVPVSSVTITTPGAIADIQGGDTATSLGYVALIDMTGGVWDGPDGEVPHDCEHVLDPEDPRVLELVDATKDDEHPFLASSLGANHFAAKLRKMTGRGAELAELVMPRDSGHQHTPTGVPSPCRVFSYFDARGIEPEPVTPIQDDTMSQTKIIQVSLVVDGLVLSPRTVDVDDETAARIAAFMQETAEQMRMMADKLLGMETERDAELEKTEAAEGEQAKAMAETEEMRDSLAKATARITELEADVKEAPKRAAELVELREMAKRVHDSVDYAKLEDAGAVKRAAVVGKAGGDKHAKSPAVVIDAVFETFVSQLADAVKQQPSGLRVDWKKQPQRSVNDSNTKPGRGAQTLAHINGPSAN